MMSRFSDIFGIFGDFFLVPHLHGAKNPQTWGLVGGQLEYDEVKGGWVYGEKRVS